MDLDHHSFIFGRCIGRYNFRFFYSFTLYSTILSGATWVLCQIYLLPLFSFDFYIVTERPRFLFAVTNYIVTGPLACFLTFVLFAYGFILVNDVTFLEYKHFMVTLLVSILTLLSLMMCLVETFEIQTVGLHQVLFRDEPPQHALLFQKRMEAKVWDSLCGRGLLSEAAYRWKERPYIIASPILSPRI